MLFRMDVARNMGMQNTRVQVSALTIFEDSLIAAVVMAETTFKVRWHEFDLYEDSELRACGIRSQRLPVHL